MPRPNDILPPGFQPVDVVKEKEKLYADLKKDYNLKDQAFYLNILIAALRCDMIDEKTYQFYSSMGVIDGIPFEIMALNLRNKLQDDLEKEFAAMDAGEHEFAPVAVKAGAVESDQDENGIAECVRDAVDKVNN